MTPEARRRRRLYGLVDVLVAAAAGAIAWRCGIRGAGLFWIALTALLSMQLLTRWRHGRRYGTGGR